MDDASERIAKAKGLAAALGLPEQAVIDAFLQAGSSDRSEQLQSQRTLGELQGQPDNLMSPELEPPKRYPLGVPITEHPDYQSGPISLKRKNSQASGVEQSSPFTFPHKPPQAY